MSWINKYSKCIMSDEESPTKKPKYDEEDLFGSISQSLSSNSQHSKYETEKSNKRSLKTQENVSRVSERSRSSTTRKLSSPADGAVSPRQQHVSGRSKQGYFDHKRHSNSGNSFQNSLGKRPLDFEGLIPKNEEEYKETVFKVTDKEESNETGEFSELHQRNVSVTNKEDESNISHDRESVSSKVTSCKESNEDLKTLKSICKKKLSEQTSSSGDKRAHGRNFTQGDKGGNDYEKEWLIQKPITIKKKTLHCNKSIEKLKEEDAVTDIRFPDLSSECDVPQKQKEGNSIESKVSEEGSNCSSDETSSLSGSSEENGKLYIDLNQESNKKSKQKKEKKQSKILKNTKQSQAKQPKSKSKGKNGKAKGNNGSLSIGECTTGTEGTSTHKDTSFREQFAMNLMKNLKCNLFYDVFCFSMPKTNDLDAKYRHKVLDITEYLGFLITNTDAVSGMNVLTKESLDHADAIVEDMWKRYNMEENSEEKDIQVDDLDKEVDNDLPHSAIFVLSDMADNVKSLWPGQFLATVNPVYNVLSVSLFTFNSNYTPDGMESFANAVFSKELSLEITQNMEAFEMSRQLRMDIPLVSVSEMYVFNQNGAQSEAVMVLKVDAQPDFYQRHIHTSAFLYNVWRKRGNFLPIHSLEEPPFLLFIGGTLMEISDIAALMIKSDTDLKDFYEAQNCSSIPEILKNLELSYPKIVFPSASQNIEDSTEGGVTVVELDPDVQAKRSIILDILTRHKLISPKQADEVRENPVDSGPDKSSTTNNYLGGLDLHACLYDYINTKCNNVIQLERYLSSRLNGSRFGYDDLDLNITNVQKNSIDDMTVGEFLRTKSHDVLYFSFCYGNVTKSRRDWHCDSCKQCYDWSAWHCPQCDRCTYCGSVPICNHCGFMEGKTVVRPNSVFIKQLQENTVLDDDGTEDKQFIDTCDDTPYWPDPCVHIKGQLKPSASFNLDEIMCDQLGLLDPMAFLLGSEARDAGSRQGRRRQKYKKKQSFNPAAAGCVIQ